MGASHRVGLALFVVALAFSVGVEPGGTAAHHGGSRGRLRGDDRPHPLGARQFRNRQEALRDRLAGRAHGRVHRLANGQFVELERETTDRVFVLLAEFGDQIDPVSGGPAGPRHNAIVQPDRTLDNSTIWRPDFDRQYFEHLIFSATPGALSLRNYYVEQSSGRYAIDGTVADWVRVPFNEAHYGHNLCDSTDCNVWDVVRDGINAWTAGRVAAGMTPAEIKDYLDQFDVRDRYDYDGDGNFDEPDGYIDRFMIVHAGEGEETGGGAEGEDAIGSHRWYVDFAGSGSTGPAFNKLGGAQFGDTGMWMGDYTTSPESGGVGVFAHEFGHELGLPEEYDIFAGTESSVAFWSIMSRGDYLGPGQDDIGSRPGHLLAWDKLQLGWLNFDTAVAGQSSDHRLGPAEFNTKQAQAIVTTLPKKIVETTLTPPYAGSFAWWSGMGDGIDNTLRRAIEIPPGPASLSMQVWYDTELDWDYAYVSVSTDGGLSWTNLATNLSDPNDPNGQNFGNGITGSSGDWVPLTADLSSYAGQTVWLRLRHWTDGFYHGLGLLADQIAVTSGSSVVFVDGAESGDNGWTRAGFSRTTGVDITAYDHYYIAEYRQPIGFDESLPTGPYPFFGPFPLQPKLVEHYAYEPGLLVSYWDSSMTDNGTSIHPGEGLILPIDARPVPLVRPNGVGWRPGVQVYDAAFSLEPSHALTLHSNGIAATYPSQPAVPEFDDRNEFWFAGRTDAGVKVPHAGVRIKVVSQSAHQQFMEVQVR